MSDGSGRTSDASEPRTRLLTRADDAGAFRAANEAIRDACGDGICRNVSVMAPGPALEHAADRLAGMDNICVGVHLTLTAEWDAPRWKPMSSPESVPSLVREDGAFYRTPAALDEREASVDEMVREARAQMTAVREAGFDPAYLDCHMGVDWVGDLADRLDDLREREGLLDGDAAASLPAVEDTGNDPDGLCARLDAAEPGTYRVVAHPCYPTEEIEQVAGAGFEPGELADERDAQRRMFTAEEVRDCLARNDAEPILFTDAADAASHSTTNS